MIVVIWNSTPAGQTSATRTPLERSRRGFCYFPISEYRSVIRPMEISGEIMEILKFTGAQSTKSPRRSKKLSLFLALGLLLVSGTFYVSTTLAANISLNSGGSVEFGQGMVATTACSGSTNLTITPTTTFTNVSGGGSYKLSGLTVGNIPSDCYGKDFVIRAYGSTSSTALALFNTSSTDVAVFNNSGSFNVGATDNNGPSGMSVTTGSTSQFTVRFSTPVSSSSDVSKLTIESVNHDSSRRFLGGIGPGGGTIFYYSATAFTAQYSTCATDCHYLEFAPENWRSPDSTLTWSADGTNSVGATTNGIGAGSANTRLMRDAAGADNTTNNAGLLALSYAASDSSAGQWYVPSNAELITAFNYSTSNGLVGGFITSEPWYWTSNQVIDNPTEVEGAAYNGYHHIAFPKSWMGHLRPIRAF